MNSGNLCIRTRNQQKAEVCGSSILGREFEELFDDRFWCSENGAVLGSFWHVQFVGNIFPVLKVL
jgi:hypothetical protein